MQYIIQQEQFEYDLFSLTQRINNWMNEEANEYFIITSILVEPTELGNWKATIKYEI